jgi:hypothetical protein
VPIEEPVLVLTLKKDTQFLRSFEKIELLKVLLDELPLKIFSEARGEKPDTSIETFMGGKRECGNFSFCRIRLVIRAFLQDWGLWLGMDLRGFIERIGRIEELFIEGN